jgi:hypothetical protein
MVSYLITKIKGFERGKGKGVRQVQGKPVKRVVRASY